jgi:dienelactone hydrolase
VAEVVLFHHVQGLTPGVVALAGAWRDAGHRVHTPDMFEGRRFDSIDSGAAYADAVGLRTLLGRAAAGVAGLPAGVVYAGVSLGNLMAEYLTVVRPGARGTLMLEGTVPVAAFAEFDADAGWPAGVPFQIHGMDGDPYFAGEGDIEVAREMVSELPHGELFLYPGAVHLFTDSGLPGYDAAATGLLTTRVAAFLDRLDRG